MAASAMEAAMLFKIIVLVCNVALQSQDCTAKNASQVITAPDDISAIITPEGFSEVTCALHTEAYLTIAGDPKPRGTTYFKVLCQRELPIEASNKPWDGASRAQLAPPQ
jgi:hypothetical protein